MLEFHRIALRLLSFICTSLLLACQSNFPAIPATQSSGSSGAAASSIAVCGAGLEKGVSAQIEAEYSKSGGKLSAGFQDFVRTAIFSRADIASADKQKIYDKYIDCVLEIDKRNRVSANSCVGKCDLIQASCIREHDRALGTCIERMRYACINVCTQNYRNTLKRCVQSFCDPGSPINVSQWSEHQCRLYRTRRDGCEGELRSCVSEC